jgi:hypothetical protein
MAGLASFMNGAIGRIARVILGVVLIYVGLSSVGGTAGVVIAVIGVVPLVMGLWGRCLIELIPGASA